ncbi:MAG: alpha/beta hydrolase [Rhodoferax sp.]|nr:alpha/beta hydrolase [Rhodoferax sp.]
MPWLNDAGATTHYSCTGAGDPALVFVHGALCALQDWQAQLDHFSQRHRVLALDLYGHGRSAVDADHIGVASFARQVRAVCAAQGIDTAVLVGHSMGCRVLLEVWRQQPALVAGLVFVDGAYLVPGLIGPGSREQREDRAQAARMRAAAPYVDVEPRERARHSFAQMFFDEQFAPQRDAIVQRAMDLPAHVARTLMPDFAAWDVLHMEPVLARLDVPALAIACTWMNPQRERVALAEGASTPWLQALEQLAPRTRIVRYTGAGHFPMLERPLDVNRDIETFLRSVATAG